MSEHAPPSRRTVTSGRPPNPFTASQLRPGQIPYLFTEEHESTEILDRVARFGGWGQIVGGHGTGKSTMMCWLIERYHKASAPHAILRVEPKSPQATTARRQNDSFTPVGSHSKRIGADQIIRLDPATGPSRSAKHKQVFVDGFDGLSWWTRQRLERCCFSRGHSLIVTTHRSLGFPTLFRTRITTCLALRIVRKLAQQRQFADEIEKKDWIDEVAISDGDTIAGLLMRHQGNMRETLFALYDIVDNAATEFRHRGAVDQSCHLDP